MRHHGQDALIQTKASSNDKSANFVSVVSTAWTFQGVRALGSGVQWPQDVQERARYSHRHLGKS